MARPPKARPPYHHGDLRAELVRRACESLREGDMPTLRELSARVGVSHAAAYRHFPNKVALLAEVARLGFESFAERLAAATTTATGAEERLVAMGRAYLAFAFDEPGMFRLMWSHDLKPFDAHPGLDEAARRSLDVLLGTFDGLGGAAERQRAALVAWSTIHGYTALALERQLEGPFDLTSAADGMPIVARGILEGVLPRKPR
ncbi:MAG: TetR/AcrR family transcriptional regulator [Myxococcales bacterium]|nr:TetR/AcrR family transcriptional regulator [Myxococcales bacterium]